MKKTNEPEPDNYFRKYKAAQGLVESEYATIKKEVERKELHAYIKSDGTLDIMLIERSQAITAMDVSTLGQYMLVQKLYKGMKTTAPSSRLKIPDELEHKIHSPFGVITANLLTGEVIDKDGNKLDADASEQIIDSIIQEMEKE